MNAYIVSTKHGQVVAVNDAWREQHEQWLADGQCALTEAIGLIVQRCDHTAPAGISERPQLFDEREAHDLAEAVGGHVYAAAPEWA